MIKEYVMPILIVVAGLVVYNLLVKKFLPANFEENFEVDANGRVLKVA